MADHRIAKPQTDDRSYRVITLPNGLRAVLISDPAVVRQTAAARRASAQARRSRRPKTEPAHPAPTPLKAAASLCLEIGSFSDPPELQGLCHFLEHMMFMGSEKYPEENDFDRFLKQHGGKANAHTENELTLYTFNMQWDRLHGALDRLSNLISAPLLTKAACKRELEAIDSEFTANLQRDYSRKLQFISHIARPDHPLHQFGWGSLASLREAPANKGIDPLEGLRNLFSQHYRANRMSLCVLGYQSIEKLEGWVRELFSSLPGGTEYSNPYAGVGLPFDEACFGKHFKLEPVHELRDVELIWQLPASVGSNLRKLSFILSNIFAQKGPGSAFSLLKHKGWVTSILAGPTSQHQRNSSFLLFSVICRLTRSGLRHIYEVVTVILQGLALIKRQGFDRWRFEELKMVSEASFRFQDREDAFTYVQTLAVNLRDYSDSLVAAGPYFLDDSDYDTLCNALNDLSVDNFVLLSRSKSYGLLGTEVEPWFGTPFHKSTIPSKWRQKWEQLFYDPLVPTLALPYPNPFAPTHFDSIDSQHFLWQVPQILVETTFSRVWYKPHTVQSIPYSTIVLDLRLADMYTSLRNAVLAELYVGIILFSLQEYTFAAQVCNLSYTILTIKSGVQIRLQGFSDKIVVLLCIILDRFKNFTMSPGIFSTVKESLSQRFENESLKPSDFAMYLVRKMLCEHEWLGLEFAEMLSTLHYQDFVEMMESPDTLNPTSLEVLVHGNHTAQEAETILFLAQSCFFTKMPNPGVQHTTRVAQVPQGAFALVRGNYNSDDTNSFVQCIFQIGGHDTRQRVVLEIIEHLINEPYFQTMRTEQQLGYDVGCGYRIMHGHLCFSLFVQSPATKFSVQEIDRRIDGFLESFAPRLRNISDKDFSETINAISMTKLARTLNQREEVDRFWAEITSRCFCFNRQEKEVEFLHKVTKEEVADSFDEYLKPSSEYRRKFCIFLQGNAVVPEGTTIPTDPYPESKYVPPQVLDTMDAFMTPGTWLPDGPDVSVQQRSEPVSSFPCTVPNLHPQYME
eukprot:m.72932 g.72932  ORF g.72932 m.72932 type:complete len:1023 (-) comp8017_c0_seq2:242-3310(-)